MPSQFPLKTKGEYILQGIQFQNGGVLEDKVSYASLADYKRAKGITSGDNTQGGTGGTGDGGELGG